MRNVLKKTLILSLLVSFTASCGSSKGPSTTPEREEEAEEAKSQYSLTYTDVMEFTRGISSEYEIAGLFSNETASRITIDGLPSDATFENNLLTWQPSCELKPENGQFIRGYMIQRLRISFESLISDGIVQKPAILLIHKNGEGSICQD